MKNLENYGVKEINTSEAKNIKGGGLSEAAESIIFGIGWLGAYIYNSGAMGFSV